MQIIPFRTTPATRSRLLLFLLWIIFYASFTLVAPPLLDDADSVHAEVAREMVLRHDWVTLYANGIRYLEKAPLLYWSMAASFKLFGPHTAAARLPIALTVLLLALLLETFGRRAFNDTRAGRYAGIIALSSFGIFIFTRITIPDAMVCLWLSAALLCYWRTDQQERPGAGPRHRLRPLLRPQCPHQGTHRHRLPRRHRRRASRRHPRPAQRSRPHRPAPSCYRHHHLSARRRAVAHPRRPRQP